MKETKKKKLKNCSLYECHIPEFLIKAKQLDELLYAVMPSGDKFLVLGQFPAVCDPSPHYVLQKKIQLDRSSYE